MEGEMARKILDCSTDLSKFWSVQMGVLESKLPMGGGPTPCKNGSALVLLLFSVIDWEQPMGITVLV